MGLTRTSVVSCTGSIPAISETNTTVVDSENDPNRAPPCDKTLCKLPDCFCSEDGTEVPGDLCPENDRCDRVPQMVTLTFDDAINIGNIDLYSEIFNKQRRNPNGCDIKGTFFVSHHYTNYSAVANMHRLGHEIAAHSITHNDDESFWSDASVEDWAREMAGSRLIIEKLGNFKDNSVVGLRPVGL